MSHSTSLGELTAAIGRRLGDDASTPASARVWGEEEIEGYVRDALRDLVVTTELLWDMQHVDDLPAMFTFTGAWERAYVAVGGVIAGPVTHTGEWERDYFEGLYPANHTGAWERTNGHLIDELIPAAEPLPERFAKVERVTWNGGRIRAMQTRSLRRRDNYFETIRGQVYGYLLDKDGVQVIRKFRAPVASAGNYEPVGSFGTLRGSADDASVVAQGVIRLHIDEWGAVFDGEVDAGPSIYWDFMPPDAIAGLTDTEAITELSEFGGDLIVSNGGFGIVRRLPGYFPANGPWGLVKRMSSDDSNTRVEGYARARLPVDAAAPIELPPWMLRYVRHYALWRAYLKRGIGENLPLAKHYKQRYQAGVMRIKDRVLSVARTKLRRMGGDGADCLVPTPYARLPRNITGS